MNSSNESNFDCDICGKELATQKGLKLHYKTHDEDKTKCDICKKGFASLNRHNVLFHGARPFKCEICGKGFKRKDTLNIHKQSHEPKQFKCNLCNKHFSRIKKETDS